MTDQHQSVPRPEYPRPDRDRSERWLNLNGAWEFAEDPDGSLTSDAVADAGRLPRTITVPFAWETPASGVERTWLETAWYRRDVAVPADWTGDRVFLCFGAVHHRAEVFVGGAKVADHRGGYVPFEIDVTDHVRAGGSAPLVVRVEAPSDKRFLVHGKQRSLPRDDYDGVSFTPSSGIWQTVWLEPRPATFVDVVRLRGDSLADVAARVAVTGPSRVGARVGLTVAGERVEATADDDGVATAVVPVASPRLWSPDDPHLYEVEVEVTTPDGVDRLTSAVGLRRVEHGPEGLRLNGERIYVRGVLDQGYWPETGITAPSDDALRRDVELARDAGFNLVRKHLKLEDPRWLRWADRLGMLVWEEPACASRWSPEATAAFVEQIRAMVDRDGNHPSIVVWGLFNEEWGFDWDMGSHTQMQADAVAAYDALAMLDRSRPIVENSGWAHVRTDLLDWHCYIEDPATWAGVVRDLAQGRRDSIPVPLGPNWTVEKPLFATPSHVVPDLPLLNSEYGGGFTNLERGWQLRWQTQELRRHDAIAGYVYCEIADIEHETAGLLYADRSAKDLGGVVAADVHGETVLVFDLVPVQAGADIAAPTESFALGVRVSHHGGAPVVGRAVAGWAPAGTPMTAALPAPLVRGDELTVEPFAVSEAVSLTVPPPAGPARLIVWFEAGGAVLARGFVDAGVVENVTGRMRLESQASNAPVAHAALLAVPGEPITSRD